MFDLIPKIPWWLLYSLLGLHEKRYATRRLRDWKNVPMNRFGYGLGWSFWVVLVIIVFLLVKMLA